MTDAIWDLEDEPPHQRDDFEHVDPIGPYIKNLNKNAQLASTISKQVKSEKLSENIKRLSDKYKVQAINAYKKDIEEEKVKECAFYATKQMAEVMRTLNERMGRETIEWAQSLEKELGRDDALQAIVGNLAEQEVMTAVQSVARKYDLEDEVKLKLERSRDKFDAIDILSKYMDEDEVAFNLYQSVGPDRLKSAIKKVARNRDKEYILDQ